MQKSCIDLLDSMDCCGRLWVTRGTGKYSWRELHALHGTIGSLYIGQWRGRLGEELQACAPWQLLVY